MEATEYQEADEIVLKMNVKRMVALFHTTHFLFNSILYSKKKNIRFFKAFTKPNAQIIEEREGVMTANIIVTCGVIL